MTVFSNIMKPGNVRTMNDSKMKFDHFDLVSSQLSESESAMSFLKIVERIEVRKALPVPIHESTILKEIVPIRRKLNLKGKISNAKLGPFMFTPEEQTFMDSTFVAKDSINISFSWGKKKK
jgi:hypothetical protein